MTERSRIYDAEISVAFWLDGVFVHTRHMADREVATLSPPPPEERNLEVEHKQLMLQLADHPDPHMRILAHMSSRQFELSERITDLVTEVREGFAALNSKVEQGVRDLKTQVAQLDKDFIELEEEVDDHERRLNGSAHPTDS